ncbi:MAG: ATP-binding protein [Chthoniobacteraceae bacterium]
MNLAQLPLTPIPCGEISAAMVRSAPDALYFRDFSGVCRFANPRCATLFGVELDELIGSPMARFFPARFACLVLRQEEAVLADGGVRSCNLTLGNKLPCRVSHHRVCDARGETTGVAGRLQDLSAIRRLEKQIVEASERELRRMACDLHDELCQELAAAALIAKLLEKRLAEGDETQAKVAAHIADLTRQMAGRTRELVYNLAPEPLAGEGFVARLRSVAAQLCAAYPVKCGIEGGWPQELKNETAAIQLFRIAHEAMHNAARHSGGDCITVRMRKTDGLFTLSVTDNGHGMGEGEGRSPGLGLASMRYRADLIEAELHFQSPPGSGTCVICKVPVE